MAVRRRGGSRTDSQHRAHRGQHQRRFPPARPKHGLHHIRLAGGRLLINCAAGLAAEALVPWSGLQVAGRARPC
jgi:hypothetical protein